MKRWSSAIPVIVLAATCNLQVATAARVRGSCPLTCENGGLCLPQTHQDSTRMRLQGHNLLLSRTHTSRKQWSCFCRPPWAGPTCSVRTDDDEVDGAAGATGLLAQHGSLLASMHPGKAGLATASASVWPVLAQPLGAQTPFVEPWLLGQRLQTLKHELSSLQETATRRPSYRLRLAFYAALCGQGHGPCPLRLTLNNIHVAGHASSGVVHLAVTSGPNTVPLDTIRGVIEQQLGDAESPLRRAGGSLLDTRPGQLGVWFRVGGPVQAGRIQRLPLHQHQQRSTGFQTSDGANQATMAALAVTGHQRGFAYSTNISANMSNSSNATDITKVAGIKKNSRDDLRSILYSLALNSTIVLICLLLLCIFRRVCPIIFESRRGRFDSGNFFSWIVDTYKLEVSDIVDKSGLDAGLLIQYTRLSRKILAVVGVPLCLVLCPLHYYCGDKDDSADLLGRLGMGNVQKGSWLCWVHPFVVWYVVLTTQLLVDHSMTTDFMPRRKQFLKDMPLPRATTVLVEDIPEELCKTQDLLHYFNDGVFGRHVVKSLHFVKDTADLRYKMRQTDQAFDSAQDRVSSLGDMMKRASLIQKRSQAERQLNQQRQLIMTDDERNTRAAFVTFETRREAAIALKMFSIDDEEEIIVSVPPDPHDVIWSDFVVDEVWQNVKYYMGVFLIFLLFVFFVPLVILIAEFASLENLGKTLPVFESVPRNYPEAALLYKGFVGSFVLSLLLSYIPTILDLIFASCFVLRAAAWLQHMIQQVFFYFLVVFVLLITAVGHSLLQTGYYILHHPLEIFQILAEKLPDTTHFYINYVAVQWGGHAMGATRYYNLMMFGIYLLFNNEADAKKKSEPEDQAYYGMGSRCSRFTLITVIGLVFCTLDPLITIVGFINFWLSELLYKYLYFFAEDKKPDLGGVFWHTMLKHTQQGLFLYVTLMTGVLVDKAQSLIPPAIAASSFIVLYRWYNLFLTEFRFESLEFFELAGKDISSEDTGAVYLQPELQVTQLERFSSAPDRPSIWRSMTSRLGMS